MRLLLSFIFTLVIGMAGAAYAENTASNYIAPENLPPTLLLPPPAENSPVWHEEIAAVIACQEHILPRDYAAMRNEQHMRLELVTDVMGKDFTHERYPQTYQLLEHVLADSERITEADKAFWHTRRPYLADAHVKLLIDHIDKSPAYPSGHTSTSRVLAEVLGMLVPEKLPLLRARAGDIAQHRIEAGVHYLVDIQGGETLAALIIGALTQNRDFQEDLNRAREEISQSR